MTTTNELLPYVRLQLNVNNPTFEECYAHGYECGLKDRDEGENPFKEGSKESDQWLDLPFRTLEHIFPN
jgi:hypothetical protein